MASQSTRLTVHPRTVEGSRATRRLRRSGSVPGVLYGGDGDAVPFSVDARELRHALAGRGAVLEVALDGDTSPAVLKDAQYDVVRGDTIHVDLLRVKLDVAIHAVVPLELTGAEEAPGTKEGGVLEHVTRELNIEALPTDIPEFIVHDVSNMEMNDTITLSVVSAPAGVTLLDDLEDTVVATLTPPRVEVEADEEIEAETELVGEPTVAAEAVAEGDAETGGDQGA
ncbi:MAG: 50S ribosomal protein L25 [Actinomycetota bacterium]|nr:50S ribosomal protein L25 [Actinomycetota bacterium]